MKISKLFHWLYFIVMMLPIMALPVFAIYSHRHTIDSYSVQVEENNIVEFNQLIENGNFHNGDNWQVYDLTDNYSFNNDSFNIFDLSDTTYNSQLYQAPFNYIRANNIYLLTIRYSCTNDLILSLSYGTTSPFVLNLPAANSLYQRLLTTSTLQSSEFSFYFRSNTGSLSFFNVQLNNLTQMFGSGNEPTIEQFNIWYPDDYYDFTTGHKELLKTGNYITYDDTDIGSQFLYVSYNYVDKYFNYDNVFNFGSLYSWLELTFFNGNATLGFFIFWHLLIYWLLTSLIWLIFDVLMYVPMLVHRWLDKAALS